jgi:hypothetical protein
MAPPGAIIEAMALANGTAAGGIELIATRGTARLLRSGKSASRGPPALGVGAALIHNSFRLG